MRRKLGEPSAAIVVVAALWRPELGEELVRREIERVYGKTGDSTGAFDFSQSDYYAREMGAGLRKCFWEIEGRAARNSLPGLKLAATELEDRHLGREGSRALNVDPMLVTLENVVVATSKNFPHRPYLGSGVFAELSFLRKRGGYEALPWTYQDYVERVAFFETLHRRLRGQPARA